MNVERHLYLGSASFTMSRIVEGDLHGKSFIEPLGAKFIFTAWFTIVHGFLYIPCCPNRLLQLASMGWRNPYEVYRNR